MDYAVLKNGTIGLQVDTTGTDQAPALDIRNTVIHNMSAYGLYAQGGTIEGTTICSTIVANPPQPLRLAAPTSWITAPSPITGQKE